MKEIADKFYLALPKETFEISEATARELMDKGNESLEAEKVCGYFWNAWTISIRS